MPILPWSGVAIGPGLTALTRMPRPISSRKLSLTEDGAAFRERAVREVEDAAADLAERRGSLSGPLRIAAPITFGRMHLGLALYPFLAQHPRISLMLELDDRRIDAAAGGCDAVVRHRPIEDA